MSILADMFAPRGDSAIGSEQNLPLSAEYRASNGVPHEEALVELYRTLRVVRSPKRSRIISAQRWLQGIGNGLELIAYG
jgi:hypothetical protein